MLSHSGVTSKQFERQKGWFISLFEFNDKPFFTIRWINIQFCTSVDCINSRIGETKREKERDYSGVEFWMNTGNFRFQWIDLMSWFLKRIGLGINNYCHIMAVQYEPHQMYHHTCITYARQNGIHAKNIHFLSLEEPAVPHISRRRNKSNTKYKRVLCF